MPVVQEVLRHLELVTPSTAVAQAQPALAWLAVAADHQPALAAMATTAVAAQAHRPPRAVRQAAMEASILVLVHRAERPVADQAEAAMTTALEP